MNVVALVVLILVVVALVQAAVWIPLTRSWRRKRAEFETGFQAELAASGERILLRESAIYRGGTGGYGAVKGNGTIILTDRRLLFRKVTGGLVDVARAKITATRRSKSFLGSRVGGRTHLVVATSDPAEVGFFVTDIDAWERELHRIGTT